jgi:acyl-CoA thioesterase-1
MSEELAHLIYFFGSGLAFFVGVASILAGLTLSVFALGRWAAMARNLAVILGAILVATSAAPLEWWLYALAGAVTCVWLPLEWNRSSLPRKAIALTRLAVLAVWLLALVLEIPYQVTPTLPTLEKPTFFLIGDSVSAGMSDVDKGTWPRLLGQQHPIDVRDCSRMGATVKSARQQAESFGEETGLVFMEIGGNDLLGTTTANQFEEQLDLLLAEVCRADRTVVMFALPLPPLSNRFGLIQRRLARKYDVILLPQHIFAGLLATPGATLDGIHLSPVGHQKMADTIWGLIGSAYE